MIGDHYRFTIWDVIVKVAGKVLGGEGGGRLAIIIGQERRAVVQTPCDFNRRIDWAHGHFLRSRWETILQFRGTAKRSTTSIHIHARVLMDRRRGCGCWERILADWLHSNSHSFGIQALIFTSLGEDLFRLGRCKMGRCRTRLEINKFKWISRKLLWLKILTVLSHPSRTFLFRRQDFR